MFCAQNMAVNGCRGFAAKLAMFLKVRRDFLICLRDFHIAPLGMLKCLRAFKLRHENH